jgi:hypothetical protein
MSINDLTQAYMNIRSERERISSEFKNQDETLKSQQVVLEQEMLKICADQGADSIRTSVGTVSRQIKNRFHILDWNSFYQFVLEQKVPQLLQKRVHETNFTDFMQGRENERVTPRCERSAGVYNHGLQTESRNRIFQS